MSLKRWAITWLAACAVVCTQSAAWADCPPRGETRQSLEALKASDFEMADAQARETLAFALIDCLASPDPALRDGIAFEALQHWMREKAFEPDRLRAMRARLFAMLEANDPQGVARPFSALMLSEVARTERVDAWMSDDERGEMVARAAEFLESVDDYRGYEAGTGWRHGVAHGADWVMQLVLNPALSRAQLDRLLHAIEMQAVPISAHAYIHGEPERLVRPLLFIARRDLYSEAEWTTWLASLSSRLGDPALAWKDADWLARRHDLAAFLHVLYVETDVSEEPGIAKLKPGVLAALKVLP